MRSESKPCLSDSLFLTPFVKWPGLLVSTPLITLSSVPFLALSGPKMASFSGPPLPRPLSSCLFIKNMSVPHSSSMLPSVARRFPVM